MFNQIDDKWYKRTLVLTFTFIFIYLFVRTIYTDTLHDEVASYMFYFYQGDYIGESMHWDANNHLLNSFLGHQLFKLFGDNFPLLRLPNLLSYILFFWGSYQLTKDLKTPWLKVIGLIALNSVPFILEFFSSARGYGLSMGLFMASIVYVHRYLRNQKATNLIGFYVCILLAISANLTLINSGLILIVLTLISLFVSHNKKTLKPLLLQAFIHILSWVCLSPLIWYGIQLKEHGALYYGSLDGFWNVTVKTLSRYVFFTDSNWIIVVYLFASFILLVSLFKLMKAIKSISDLLQNPLIVYTVLILGNLSAIFILANLFSINYPEDRTAMYLIPLSLLLIITSFDTIKEGRFFQFTLLFFPIALISQMSIETSVFYPDDRMNRTVYQKVKKEINPSNSIMIYPIMNWNWPYLESKQKSQASVAQFSNPNSILADFLITKTTEIKNKEIFNLYDTVAYHPASTHIAFKRKHFLERDLLLRTPKVNATSQNEFIDIGNLFLDNYPDKNVMLSIKGHLKTIDKKDKLSLVVSVKNKKGEDTRYLYYSFETVFQSKLINTSFSHHFLLDNVSPEESEIKVYLWNRGLNLCELTNANCDLLELKEPKNESR